MGQRYPRGVSRTVHYDLKMLKTPHWGEIFSKSKMGSVTLKHTDA